MTNKKPSGLPRRGEALYREDWPAIIAKAKKKPGEIALVLKDRPISRAKSLNTRRTPPFVTPEGHLRGYVRDSYDHASGVRYGDIHVSWQPNESN